MKSIQNLAKARALSIGLGLLATSAPLFAQTPATPATPAAPVAPALITDPQAKALFEQSIESYKNLKNVTVTYTSGSSSQLIQFSAPDSIKVTYLDKKGEMAAMRVFTPTEIIVLQKPVKDFEYTSTPRAAVPAGKDARALVATTGVGSPLLASFLAGVSPFGEGGLFKATSYTLGEPTGDEGMDLTPVIVTSTSAQKLDLTFTFYIGQQDKLVHKTEIGIKTPDGQSQKIVESYKSMQTGAELPAGTFDFTAPAGATKVAQFTRPAAPVMVAKVGELPLALPTGAKDIDGKDITFDQFKGKVTLVDFWATWCGPCKAELPNVKTNYAKYHDKGFEVVGISLDQSTDPLFKYIKANDMPWRQVFDGYWDGPIATSFNVKAIPATILIGKDGKIAAIGARGEALEPAIQAALAAN